MNIKPPSIKLNLLDTHDRYEYFVKQKFDISECCQDLIDQRPFGSHAFYIFAHARTADNGVDKRLIWQPRLTRPEPQTNSMLFKAYPNKGDEIKVIWMIPAKEMWSQFKRGLVSESSVIMQSIIDFRFNIEKLRMPEADDLSESEIDAIYREISLSAKPISLEASSTETASAVQNQLILE